MRAANNPAAKGTDKLAGGERDAMDYVRQLHSSGANWRAAFELASLIQNDPKLARDPRLLGELCGLLDQEVAHPGGDPEVPRYLAHTLGAFQSLDARAADGTAADPLRSLAGALDPKQPATVRDTMRGLRREHATPPRG